MKCKNNLLFKETAVWKSIESTLTLFGFLQNSKEERSTVRVIDLGCYQGEYTAEFAKLGFDTIGMEAREDNLLRCNELKTNLRLTNLNFIKDDVRNIANYGKFDIVLCYGLLYHLNDPASFLKQLYGSTNKLLLLNTHFSPERDIRYGLGIINTYFIAPIQKRIHLFEYTQNYRLSPLVLNENYRGRWYKEWNKSLSQNKIEKYLLASYNNDRSFWLCKKDLTRAIHDAGFNNVFEQFNYTGDLMPHHYSNFYNRAMFVAIKGNPV